MAAGVQQKTIGVSGVRTAPPVYRPQTAVQSKSVVAPPVYRPLPAGAQRKLVAAFPPLHRSPAGRVQLKSAAADFKKVTLSNLSLNEVLKAVSGRPAEVHHLLYKAKRPSLANNVGNLVLSQRSESEKRSGPGQHELMHMVSSGNDKDKFNVLLDEFEYQYKSYMKPKSILL